MPRDSPRTGGRIRRGLREAVKGVKRTALTGLQNDACARNPVGALTVGEVTDDVKCAPGFAAFVPPLISNTMNGTRLSSFPLNFTFLCVA